MEYPTDSSTQLDYATLSMLPTFSSVTNPSILFNDGTSGIYNNTTNSIIVFTSSTTALTIDTNQCLYGNGTGLTNIGYNNVINKPTNFQSDWNSTIINKPTNFQSDWDSTIINKPDLSVYATDDDLNSLSSYSYLNISGNTAAITNLNNKTIFTNLYVNGASTLLSSLNVSGFTKLNKNTTFISSLNVSGFSCLI
jgi:hypothetical protein